MAARLTAMQRAFVNHYMVTLNGVEAARKAGYKGGYSVLGVQAHNNLKNPKIKAEIDTRLQEQQAGADQVLAHIIQHATGSMSDFLVEDEMTGDLVLSLKKARSLGKLNLIKRIDQEVGTTISEDGTIEKVAKTKIELYGADTALRDLVKILGMGSPVKVQGSVKHDHSGDVNHHHTAEQVHIVIPDNGRDEDGETVKSVEELRELWADDDEGSK